MKPGKLVFVEGPRNVGKSFMIEEIKDMHLKNIVFPKFDFTGIHDFILKNNNLIGENSPKDRKAILGVSFGKDLQTLQFLKEKIFEDKIIIMDRGFLSSAVYGILFNRFSEEEAIQYLEYIQNRFFSQEENQAEIIYVDSQKKNPFDRGYKDKWNNLDQTDSNFQSRIYNGIINNPLLEGIRKRIHMFNNDFDEDSRMSFKKMIWRILPNEY